MTASIVVTVTRPLKSPRPRAYHQPALAWIVISRFGLTALILSRFVPASAAANRLSGLEYTTFRTMLTSITAFMWTRGWVAQPAMAASIRCRLLIRLRRCRWNGASVAIATRKTSCDPKTRFLIWTGGKQIQPRTKSMPEENWLSIITFNHRRYWPVARRVIVDTGNAGVPPAARGAASPGLFMTAGKAQPFRTEGGKAASSANA